MKYDNEQRSRGFGFVVFPTVALLEDAFDFGDHWIDGKKVAHHLPDSWHYLVAEVA